MLNFLYVIPALPFAGFIVLATAGRRLSRTAVSFIGAGTVGLSALLSILCAVDFLNQEPAIHVFIQTFRTWLRLDQYEAAFSLLLDPLSLIMMLVITVVGFLIHLYSVEFMGSDEGFSRFFAYMNLFVSSMLILVLADNLLLLYLGWEGVGLCSYLLIGFWYRDEANGAAARKAFIVTRVGDTAMALGLFLLFTNLGTLNIQELMQNASRQWSAGSPLAVLAAALLLGGAVGKSAQLPLQTWLPDAMAGPSPVSALIHAATMVTAGVYLIARTNVLFSLAPAVQFAVAVIGAITLLLAGLSALTQRDLKRVLAYSTISQIGYMFLALGVGAWSAAMFHFMTHAFFKALLFLAAGAVIVAQHHEHDMFGMGGLRKRLPLIFWTFLIGASSLAALPFVTAGFYSKDAILWYAWASPLGNKWFWLAGITGAFITTVYSFRMLFLVFFGEQKKEISMRPGWRMHTPLVLLAVSSTVAGFVELPPLLGDSRLFSRFLETALPALHVPHNGKVELSLLIITGALQAAGLAAAYLFFFRSPRLSDRLLESPPLRSVHRLWFSGWGFDRLYDAVLVQPFLWISRTNKNDVVDSWYSGISAVNRGLHFILSISQTGNMRWYAMGLVFGAVLFVGIVVMMH